MLPLSPLVAPILPLLPLLPLFMALLHHVILLLPPMVALVLPLLGEQRFGEGIPEQNLSDDSQKSAKIDTIAPARESPNCFPRIFSQ